jgi:hypothetical protein
MFQEKGNNLVNFRIGDQVVIIEHDCQRILKFIQFIDQNGQNGVDWRCSRRLA